MGNFEVVRLDAVLAKSAGTWEQIIAKNCINPSMLPGWLKCVSQAFNRAIDVYLHYQDGQVVGIIPFYREQRRFLGLKLSTVCLAGNLVSYHQELVVVPEFETQVVTGFLDYIFQLNVDFFVAHNLLNSCDTFNAFLHNINQNNRNYEQFDGESSPYLKLENTWEDLLKTKARKFRYKVKSRQKELESKIDCEVKWFNNDSDSLLDFICQIESNSWKVDENMDITSNQVEKEYYAYLLPYMAEKGLLNAIVLFVKGKPAAYSLSYYWLGKIGQLKTSFDKDCELPSPGATVIEAALREYFVSGFNEFDFLGDVMPHKTSWTSEVRAHDTLFIYSSSYKSKSVFFLKKMKKMILKILSSAK